MTFFVFVEHIHSNVCTFASRSFNSVTFYCSQFIKAAMTASTVWPENQVHSATLEVTDDLKIQIWGYKRNKSKNILCWVFYILTLGFLRLFFYWKPDWFARATGDPCPLNDADIILIRCTVVVFVTSLIINLINFCLGMKTILYSCDLWNILKVLMVSHWFYNLVLL